MNDTTCRQCSCSDCDDPCDLDLSIPCSPDCEHLRPDHTPDIAQIACQKCDALTKDTRLTLVEAVAVNESTRIYNSEEDKFGTVTNTDEDGIDVTYDDGSLGYIFYQDEDPPVVFLPVKESA